MDSIPKKLKDISDKYGVIVGRDTENCRTNEGACASRNIWLGSFDDPEIETVAFFHELGHALSNELVCKRGCVMTTISGEGLAWELGFGLAFEHGYAWEYDSPAMKYARKRFETYFREFR